MMYGRPTSLSVSQRIRILRTSDNGVILTGMSKKLRRREVRSRALRGSRLECTACQ